LGREATRVAQRSTVLATDRAAGIKARVLRGDGSTDDLTLLDRVESEIFRDPSIPKGDINLMVVDGRAVIRGQVSEPQIGAIEAAVRKVVGVKDVENLLHTPGTPAPNKASARAAGNGGPGSA
jgi:osmotically-inducible protein OsmY